MWIPVLAHARAGGGPSPTHLTPQPWMKAVCFARSVDRCPQATSSRTCSVAWPRSTAMCRPRSVMPPTPSRWPDRCRRRRCSCTAWTTSRTPSNVLAMATSSAPNSRPSSSTRRRRGRKPGCPARGGRQPGRHHGCRAARPTDRVATRGAGFAEASLDASGWTHMDGRLTAGRSPIAGQQRPATIGPATVNARCRSHGR